MRYFPNETGWIEVVVGSMFSGKTTELLRRLDRYRRAGRHVQVFSRDTRYAEHAIVSHDRREAPATYAVTSDEIRERLDHRTQIVGIDEGQFYDEGLIRLCHELALDGKIIIVAGLDQDFRTEPFGVMTALMAEAEFVEKLAAVCQRCGNPAIRNFRKGASEERIVIGAADMYQALCRRCYEQALKEGLQGELFASTPVPTPDAWERG